MNRREHMDWCKERAMQYCKAGDYSNAISSMLSDLGKHIGTTSSVRVATVMAMTILMNPDRASVEGFIQGFN